jgi:hypothetical protein
MPPTLKLVLEAMVRCPFSNRINSPDSDFEEGVDNRYGPKTYPPKPNLYDSYMLCR